MKIEEDNMYIHVPATDSQTCQSSEANVVIWNTEKYTWDVGNVDLTIFTTSRLTQSC